MPPYQRTPFSLEEVLTKDGLSIIAEIKKTSPSRGLIRPDFDPEDLSKQYEYSGASAISVLTEPKHFGGSLEDLALVRNTVHVPVLRKDFVVDPYQLYEARAYGADAVLLIAAVLDRYELYDLHQTAESLGLSCLVELHELDEIGKLDLDHVKIIGVNNRDLRTFLVDIHHSLRVFEHIPEGIIRVSESGLRSARELAHLHSQGVNAVLMGETFMRAGEPGIVLRALIQELRSL